MQDSVIILLQDIKQSKSQYSYPAATSGASWQSIPLLDRSSPLPGRVRPDQSL